MKVLVTAGSKHGATMEIAEAIGRELAGRGLQVDTVAPDRVQELAGYDAAVIGSGVYMGRWVGSARELVERNAAALRERPVWLFSSGPLGEPLKPEGEPADVVALVAATAARGHRTFGGKVDRRTLGFGEKAIVAMVKAPDGDYRPWGDIREWADAIAADLLGAGGSRDGAPALAESAGGSTN